MRYCRSKSPSKRAILASSIMQHYLSFEYCSGHQTHRGPSSRVAANPDEVVDVRSHQVSHRISIRSSSHTSGSSKLRSPSAKATVNIDRAPRHFSLHPQARSTLQMRYRSTHFCSRSQTGAFHIYPSHHSLPPLCIFFSPLNVHAHFAPTSRPARSTPLFPTMPI